jgi:hypothetical protein
MKTNSKDTFFWIGLVSLVLGVIGIFISIVPFWGLFSSFFGFLLFLISFFSLIIAMILKKRKITLLLSFIPIFIGFTIGTIQLLFFTDLHSIAMSSENNSDIKTEIKESYTVKIITGIKDGLVYVVKGTLGMLKNNADRGEIEYDKKYNSSFDTTNNPFFQNEKDTILQDK